MTSDGVHQRSSQNNKPMATSSPQSANGSTSNAKIPANRLLGRRLKKKRPINPAVWIMWCLGWIALFVIASWMVVWRVHMTGQNTLEWEAQNGNAVHMLPYKSHVASTTNRTTSRVIHTSLENFPNKPRGSLRLGQSMSRQDIATFLPVRPRLVGAYWNAKPIRNSTARQDEFLTMVGVEVLDPNMVHLRMHRSVSYTFPEGGKDALARLAALAESEDYDEGATDQVETKDCRLLYSWQKRSFPSCNLLLEQDLSTQKLIAHGYWRDVFQFQGSAAVLKTIRYMHDYTPRNYDRHRRDALVMERLTPSPHVLDIYAFCGNSGIFEFANGGDINDAISDRQSTFELTTQERLIIAQQATSGLADLHNMDREGLASVSHTDITPTQFVLVNDEGIYKLNDFNRARFITFNHKKNASCPFHVGSNPGLSRSPEEYTPPHIETEKIDIYSLGNVFYSLLTNKWPFEDVDLKEKKVQDNIRKGVRPDYSGKKNTTDPYEKAIIHAMEMAWIHNPGDRASARQIQSYLDDQLAKLHVPFDPDDPNEKTKNATNPVKNATQAQL